MANTGYQIHPTYKKVTDDVNQYPLDVNNHLVSISGLPQATMPVDSEDANYKVYNTSACPLPIVYYNVVKTGTATKNNCDAGYIGSTETYTVEAGTYNSIVSQAAADSAAQGDVDANKQAYANTVGICSLVTYTPKWIIDASADYCEQAATDF